MKKINNWSDLKKVVMKSEYFGQCYTCAFYRKFGKAINLGGICTTSVTKAHVDSQDTCNRYEHEITQPTFSGYTKNGSCKIVVNPYYEKYKNEISQIRNSKKLK